MVISKELKSNDSICSLEEEKDGKVSLKLNENVANAINVIDTASSTDLKKMTAHEMSENKDENTVNFAGYRQMMRVLTIGGSGTKQNGMEVNKNTKILITSCYGAMFYVEASCKFIQTGISIFLLLFLFLI